MGCCGCSLYTSAIVAAIFTFLQCLSRITWTSLFIANTYLQGNGTADNGTNTKSPEDKTVIRVVADEYQELFKKQLAALAKRPELIPLCATELALAILWFFTAISLLVGNKKGSGGNMRPWILMTTIIVITDIAASGYYLFTNLEKIRAVGQKVQQIFYIPEVILAILFSGGGPIVWIIFIAFIIYVNQRIREVRVYGKNRDAEPPQRDIELTPVKGKAPAAYDDGRYKDPPADYGDYEEDVRQKPPRDYDDRRSQRPPRDYDDRGRYDHYDGRDNRGDRSPARDHRYSPPYGGYDQPDRGDRSRPPPHSYVRDSRPEPMPRRTRGYDRDPDPVYENDPRGQNRGYDGRGRY